MIRCAHIMGMNILVKTFFLKTTVVINTIDTQEGLEDYPQS